MPRAELSSDPTIRTHLSALYDKLLEQNLLRIVEPYRVVEVEYVAQQVGQGRQAVEIKLSQMILDKVFHGVLDQGRGCLIVFEEAEADVRHLLFPECARTRVLMPWCVWYGRIRMERRLRRWSRSGRSWTPCMLRCVSVRVFWAPVLIAGVPVLLSPLPDCQNRMMYGVGVAYLHLFFVIVHSTMCSEWS